MKQFHYSERKPASSCRWIGRHTAARRSELCRVNQEWAIDFVADGVAIGRGRRMLTIVDSFTRECLAIEVDREKIACLEDGRRLAFWKSKPQPQRGCETQDAGAATVTER